MQQLTADGQRIVNDVAQRHGFSSEAVTEMLRAVSAGYGSQAQFNHFEFGGMGQWSSGGMVMIGDMFNNQLAGRVSALCQELSGLIQSQPMFARPAQSQSQSGGGSNYGNQGQMQGGGGQQQSQGGGGYQQNQGGGFGTSLFVAGTGNADWWPADLGAAGSIGAQNNLRYAYFPGARRLAIDVNGQVSVYDTGDHQIGGFSQQQSGDQSISFNSQYGLIRVADLPIVSGPGAGPGAGAAAAPSMVAPEQAPPLAPAPPAEPIMQTPVAGDPMQPGPAPAPAPARTPLGVSSDEIFALIEKLADLHAKGILTDAEFETKKAELISRI